MPLIGNERIVPFPNWSVLENRIRTITAEFVMFMSAKSKTRYASSGIGTANSPTLMNPQYASRNAEPNRLHSYDDLHIYFSEFKICSNISGEIGALISFFLYNRLMPFNIFMTRKF